jgi:hypothetical protein
VTDPAKLQATAARLWELLEPYRAHLEPNDLYGLPTLRWPGAKAHAFFAGVRTAERHVALHLMPLATRPALADELSAELRRRLKGKTTFNFTTLEPEIESELGAFVARCFEVYRAEHAG